jgi:hypothetical protein
MGLSREIRHQVAKLCRRLLGDTVERAPEWNQIGEFECVTTACDQEKSDGCEPRLGTACEVHRQVAASFAPTQRRAGIPASDRLSASDVAREVLGPNSSATISNVLVLGAAGSTPLKRVEINLRDPTEVLATLNLLAVALQESGVDFLAVRNPGVPATQIWLTSPLHGGKKTLLSCAAMVGVPVA